MKPIRTRTKWIILTVFLFTASLMPVFLLAQKMEETMIEQIVRLETTLAILKRGYTIVQQGLTVISDLKKGQFDLHSDFFQSLMGVKPSIRNDVRVASILSMQLQIIVGCTRTMAQYVQAGNFTPADLSYLAGVYSHLKDLTLLDVDELTTIISDDNWQMSDDQRLSRLDHLYKQVQDKYLFLRAFSDRVRQEGEWRTRDKINLQNLSKLINP